MRGSTVNVQESMGNHFSCVQFIRATTICNNPRTGFHTEDTGIPPFPPYFQKFFPGGEREGGNVDVVEAIMTS